MAFERKPFAEMAEWLKAHDWKSCDAGMYPEVQILFSAPKKQGRFFSRPFSFFVPNLEEDLRDELPVKQDVDNVLQGRDK